MNPCHAAESCQTLRFGERCSQVQKHGVNDMTASVQAALKQLADDITHLEAEIVRKERWETRLVRRQDVDTVAGAFGEGANYTREEVKTTSVLVGAEKEREELERLLQRQLDLQGLGGQAVIDYREMKAREAADGGMGRDFREKDRFRRKMKAKDFEEEVVLADALRFIFRKAPQAAELFGETEDTRKRRMSTASLHPNYYQLAQSLRTAWEDQMAAGNESRTFGVAMMSQCQEWAASFKGAPDARDKALEALATQADLRAFN